MRNIRSTSDPDYEAADAAVNRTLDEWAAAEKRQEKAFVDAGVW
jgi:hypothetical protein